MTEAEGAAWRAGAEAMREAARSVLCTLSLEAGRPPVEGGRGNRDAAWTYDHAATIAGALPLPAPPDA